MLIQRPEELELKGFGFSPHLCLGNEFIFNTCENVMKSKVVVSLSQNYSYAMFSLHVVMDVDVTFEIDKLFFCYDNSTLPYDLLWFLNNSRFIFNFQFQFELQNSCFFSLVLRVLFFLVFSSFLFPPGWCSGGYYSVQLRLEPCWFEF